MLLTYVIRDRVFNAAQFKFIRTWLLFNFLVFKGPCFRQKTWPICVCYNTTFKVLQKSYSITMTFLLIIKLCIHRCWLIAVTHLIMKCRQLRSSEFLMYLTKTRKSIIWNYIYIYIYILYKTIKINFLKRLYSTFRGKPLYQELRSFILLMLNLILWLKKGLYPETFYTFTNKSSVETISDVELLLERIHTYVFMNAILTAILAAVNIAYMNTYVCIRSSKSSTSLIVSTELLFVKV